MTATREARSGPAGGLPVFESAETLARSVAQWVLAVVEARPGASSVCLSGGSTPRRLYEWLASPAMAARFPWSRVHWFWGDERFVPHDHPDSNYRMVREALLSVAPVPAGNVHAIPTENLSPADAALAYQTTLERHYGADRLDPLRPLFDINLLGLGEDGHTASLFPGDPALAERTRWAVAVPAGRAEPRITLTYPALESSRHVAFLVAGAGKREILSRVRAGDPALPAVHVHPVGEIHWFVDRAAAPDRPS